MTFILKIDCDNAAFEGDPGAEVSRILRDAAGQIDHGLDRVRLRDANGNTVGAFRFIGDPPPSKDALEKRRKLAELAEFVDLLMKN